MCVRCDINAHEAHISVTAVGPLCHASLVEVAADVFLGPLKSIDVSDLWEKSFFLTLVDIYACQQLRVSFVIQFSRNYNLRNTEH